MKAITRFSCWRALLIPALFCLVASIAFSQAFEGQITGKVTDPSGAVIPTAPLTATNLATKTDYSTTTNKGGLYRFPSLPPGQYRIRCSFAGFKKFEQGPIVIQVAQVFELNIGLVPGQISEQITVSTTPPPLETESSTLGQVVTTRSIEGLPLNVRDPLALVALTPGVVLGSTFGNGGGNDVGGTSSNLISMSEVGVPARRKS